MRRAGPGLILGLLAAALVLALLVSLGIGRYGIAPTRIAQILLALDGADAIERHVVLTVRLPCVQTALLAGAGLALCGAALQGVFRNPFVGPHIIGFSTGATFGRTLAILMSESRGLLLMLAFLFGMMTLLSQPPHRQ